MPLLACKGGYDLNLWFGLMALQKRRYQPGRGTLRRDQGRMVYRFVSGDAIMKSVHVQARFEVWYDYARLESMLSRRTVAREGEWRVGVSGHTGAGEGIL